MLSYHVIEAVTQGLFHIYTAEHVSEGIELLTDFPAGFAPEADVNEVIHYPYDSVLGYAQKVLRTYRIACQLTQHTKTERRRFFGSAER